MTVQVSIRELAPVASSARAKFAPPALAPSQVPRAALHARVFGAPAVKVVLVRAPAGFGKTTAMNQLRQQMEQRGVATAWLTLDGADNDAARFLSCLESATLGIMSDAIPSAGSAPGDVMLRLADALGQQRADQSPFVLFLDDFECVHDPVVLGLVREILAHLPRNGQLVIGSRSLPDLGLGRLRGRGQLLDIDASQLRFSMAETLEFLTQRRCLALRQEQLSQLHRKTEGWVAALWLASLALEQRAAPDEFIARFSGSDLALTQYLADDVLARQPAAVRDFLLRTSILRHFNAPLCDALTGRGDSAALLLQLDAANLFLTALDHEDGQYRYHGLFADFLRAQLVRERPAETAQLHRAASRWYESQQQPVAAIDHAIAAEDTDGALRLLALHAQDLLAQGRIRLLTRWFDTMPVAALRAYPELQAIRVWALCFMRGPGAALALLEPGCCAHLDNPQAAVSVAALRPVLLAMMDDYEQAYATGRVALTTIPASATFVHTALTNAMADVFSIMGHYQEARKLLDQARRCQSESAGAFNAMYSETIEGIIDWREGRMRQASARFRMAVSATHAGPYGQTHGNAWAGVLHANALYEAGDSAQAEHLLNIYLPLATTTGLVDHMISGHVILSRIAFARGDVERTFQLLTELEYWGHRRQLPRLAASARLERSRVYLLQGNLDAARSELERADERAVWLRVQNLRLIAHDVEYIELGRLRLAIAGGEVLAALPSLQREIDAARDASRHRRALKLRLLQALALRGNAEHRAAHALLGGVLTDACREGVVRLILDEGPQVGALLRSALATQDTGGLVADDPVLSEYRQRLLQSFGPLAAEPEASSAAACDLPEALTRQELRVLTLLAEGYSNSAIGEKLFVSENTVRTHLRGINAKLGAGNRTQAVAIARRLGVLR